MARESELFIDRALFGDGPLSELLTSRVSFANEALAAFYGIDGFPDGATLDAEGFASVALPETRSGLVTMPGFLLSHAYPSPSSIVRRGALVRSLLACEINPNEELRPDIGIPPDATEREKADLRIEHAECRSCHELMDPFGIPLEVFDYVGRYRSDDASGRPIDPSTSMPPDFGGARVADAREMAAELAKSEVLGACLAKNLVAFALSDAPANAPLERRACAARDIERSFREAGDESFVALVREVASSPILTRRVVEP